MQQPIFYGDYSVSLDDRSILTLPAEVQACLTRVADDGWWLLVGANGKLWIYPEHYFVELTTRPHAEQPIDGDIDPFRLQLASAVRTNFDRSGRLIVPDELVRVVGLAGRLILVGARDHLELWNESGWRLHCEKLMLRFQSAGR